MPADKPASDKTPHQTATTVVPFFGPDRRGGSTYCVAQAALARRRAARMAHPELRASMLRVAALWDVLARRRLSGEAVRDHGLGNG